VPPIIGFGSYGSRAFSRPARCVPSALDYPAPVKVPVPITGASLWCRRWTNPFANLGEKEKARF
jgi:hypothetical protein